VNKDQYILGLHSYRCAAGCTADVLA